MCYTKDCTYFQRILWVPKAPPSTIVRHSYKSLCSSSSQGLDAMANTNGGFMKYLERDIFHYLIMENQANSCKNSNRPEQSLSNHFFLASASDKWKYKYCQKLGSGQYKLRPAKLWASILHLILKIYFYYSVCVLILKMPFMWIKEKSWFRNTNAAAADGT